MSNEKIVNSEIVKELVAIKKLLALNLLRDGASQKEVSIALDVHQTTVGRMFPRSEINQSDD